MRILLSFPALAALAFCEPGDGAPAKPVASGRLIDPVSDNEDETRGEDSRDALAEAIMIIQSGLLGADRLRISSSSPVGAAEWGSRKFNARLGHHMDSLRSVMDDIRALPNDPSCPPQSIRLTNGETITIDRNSPDFTGSGSRLFIASASLPIIVKYIHALDEDALEGIAKDHAFMQMFAGRGIVPEVYEIDPSTGMSPACSARLLVSEFVGHTPLKELSKHGLDKDARVIYNIAAKSLEMLKQVHRAGLVHGDMHSGNMAFDFVDGVDPSTSLKILDFGRAISYMNSRGEHVADGEVIPVPDWLLPWMLSPFELAGSRKTRRDDIYRLAEALIEASGYEEEDYTHAMSNYHRMGMFGETDEDEVSAAIGAKADRELSRGIPSLLKEFFEYAKTLGFDERPNYEGWIHKFSQGPAE
jgi:serine/threonine protein kinase